MIPKLRTVSYTHLTLPTLLCVDLGGRRIIKKIKNWEATLPTQPTGKVFSAERGSLNPEK